PSVNARPHRVTEGPRNRNQAPTTLDSAAGRTAVSAAANDDPGASHDLQRPTTSAASAARAGNGAAHQPGHLPRRERHSAATAQTAGGTSAAGRRGLLSAAEHHTSGEYDKRPPPRTGAATAAPTEPGAALQPGALPAARTRVRGPNAPQRP